jgi:hypothetical protein
MAHYLLIHRPRKTQREINPLDNPRGMALNLVVNFPALSFAGTLLRSERAFERIS